ncbi:RagB/SusD family nutrient uptake outer membrane protein [Sunxiuqinia sp. A32]|uniref:RagB/SusD family nutrient uptake outer membrane protein n=1 Tax=Sunxiuqinia sp. A32 TaxID=3461496 RepID=UPI004045EEEC
MKTKILSIYKVILIGAFAILIGCDDDFLETIPKGTLSDANFWKTEKDAEIFVNNIYNVLIDQRNIQFDAMSDMMVGNIAYEQGATINFVQGLVLSDNVNADQVWTSRYKFIRAANDFLSNAEMIPEEAISQENRSRLVAEARFFRAYSYAYLTALYGDVPLIKEPIGIDEAREYVRTPINEVNNFVLQELQAAADNLPVTSTQVGRITKGAALAMRARYALWMKRYDEARKSSSDVINLDKYSLYPEYKGLFTEAAENNVEVILDKQFIKNDFSNNIFNRMAPFSQNGLNYYQPTGRIADEFEMQNGSMINEDGSGYDPYNPYENRDPRLGYSLFHLGSELPNGEIYDSRPGGKDDYTLGFQTTKTGYNLRKYVNAEDFGDGANCGINFILIRYAEVLLTYAEAKIELNEIDQSVFDAINEVRQRSDVNMPEIESTLGQEGLRQAVRHERAVELAFEGLRWFDLKRWEATESILQGSIEGMTYTNTEGDLVKVIMTDFTWNFDPKNYLWPIPVTEIILSDGTLQQNTGY